MRHAIRTAALVVVTAIASLIVSPPTAKASDLLTVAQATQQRQSDSRYSSRGTRKLVKLGIIGLFGVVAIGSWAVKKARGSSSDRS